MRKFLIKIRNWIIILWALQLAYAILLIWVNPPITWTMIRSVFSHWNTEYHFMHHNIDYADMGDQIKWAVISSEDQLFDDHRGFDVKSIKKVIDGEDRQKMRGASTISQQTAKNVFLYNGRNWVRKGLEAYFTFEIELLWGKRRILETYLNVAEMGPNVFGIDAAADYHFHKNPKDLTASEAAFIAALLPNPEVRSLRADQRAKAKVKSKWIMGQMKYLKQDTNLKNLIQGDEK